MTSHDRRAKKPSKRPFAPAAEVRIGPRWVARIEGNYHPELPASVKVSLFSDASRAPFVLFMRAGELDELISALETARGTL